MYKENIFYLIGGANGSGKTTLGRELISENPDLEFLNADEIASAEGVNSLRAGSILFKRLENVFSESKSFVLETTLSGKFHNKVIKRAHDMNYKVVFAYVMLSSVEQNLARVRQRVAMGGHDVPEKIIRRRYQKSILNFEDVYKQSDNWTLYYNGDKTPELIACGVRDKINIVNGTHYKIYMDARDKCISDNLMRLAGCGASRAQQAANVASIPVVYARTQEVQK